MAVNTKRVFYVKYLAHQSYIDTLAKRPDIRLDKLENDSAAAVAAPIMEAAHAYQIGSSRDELATRFHATGQLIAGMPNLLIVSANGAGYDTIDVKACTAAGILVLNQAGGNRESVAEHVLGMMLSLTKRISQSDRAIRRGDAINRNSFVGAELHGKTIGIVGLGHVGRRVAELCHGLFAMHVLAYDPYLTSDEIAERGAEKVGLDVWGKEPPPRENPLLQFDNVLASPHTAGITREARENMGRIAAEQLIDALDGKPAPRVVNPEVWPLYAERFERTLGFVPRAR